MIVTALNIDEIAETLADTVIRALGVHHCLLYTRTGAGAALRLHHGFGAAAEKPAPFPEHLGPGDFLREHFQSRPVFYRKKSGLLSGPETVDPQLDGALDAFGAVLAVPLFFKDTLNGLILAGEKTSGAPYEPEDLDLLEILAGQGALAIQNALAYQALSNMNRELEKRVAERTRRLEAALKEKERTREQLVRSESLAAIGQLVAGVAHELNNPLASVKSLLQSVQEDVEQGVVDRRALADLVDDLNFADGELNRASDIVASLLGLSRQTQTYREPVDVNSVLADALRVLKNRYKQLDVCIDKHFTSRLPAITGNFANLGQVAINIIGNAIDALPARKGRIQLTTAYREETAEVIFECRDNGPGIPASVRREIFKPFFTTKPVGRGTGLGLYICHEIVSRHNGTIAVGHPSAGGTRVCVCLPVNGTGASDGNARLSFQP